MTLGEKIILLDRYLFLNYLFQRLFFNFFMISFKDVFIRKEFSVTDITGEHPLN